PSLCAIYPAAAGGGERRLALALQLTLMPEPFFKTDVCAGGGPAAPPFAPTAPPITGARRGSGQRGHGALLSLQSALAQRLPHAVGDGDHAGSDHELGAHEDQRARAAHDPAPVLDEPPD